MMTMRRMEFIGKQQRRKRLVWFRQNLARISTIHWRWFEWRTIFHSACKRQPFGQRIDQRLDDDDTTRRSINITCGSNSMYPNSLIINPLFITYPYTFRRWLVQQYNSQLIRRAIWLSTEMMILPSFVGSFFWYYYQSITLVSKEKDILSVLVDISFGNDAEYWNPPFTWTFS